MVLDQDVRDLHGLHLQVIDLAVWSILGNNLALEEKADVYVSDGFPT